MKQSITISLLLSFLFLFTASFAQDCATGRFYDPVFPNWDRTTAVRFGENVQPNFLDPNATQVLRMDIFEPEGDLAPERPLIILAFGGAFVAGIRQSPDIVELCERFAQLGYVTATIDYRLSTEMAVFGGDERQGVLAVMKATHDMRAAIRFFYKDALTDNNYRIDTSKIFIGGVSAGAFAALHTAYLDDLSEIPSVILNDTAGLGGLSGLSGNQGYSEDVAGVINLCGALGDTAWLVPGNVPLVSVHGTDDGVVPYGTDIVTANDINLLVYGSEPTHVRAENIGIRNELLTLPDAPHTPFILGDDPEPYMDSTFWFVRDFLYEEVCSYSVANEVALWEGVKAYPNPATDRFEIALGSYSGEAAQYQLTDMAGKIVNSGKIQARISSIETSNLQTGIYMLKLWKGNQRFIQKIIIQ